MTHFERLIEYSRTGYDTVRHMLEIEKQRAAAGRNMNADSVAYGIPITTMENLPTHLPSYSQRYAKDAPRPEGIPGSGLPLWWDPVGRVWRRFSDNEAVTEPAPEIVPAPEMALAPTGLLADFIFSAGSGDHSTIYTDDVGTLVSGDADVEVGDSSYTVDWFAWATSADNARRPGIGFDSLSGSSRDAVRNGLLNTHSMYVYEQGTLHEFLLFDSNTSHSQLLGWDVSDRPAGIVGQNVRVIIADAGQSSLIQTWIEGAEEMV